MHSQVGGNRGLQQVYRSQYRHDGRNHREWRRASTQDRPALREKYRPTHSASSSSIFVLFIRNRASHILQLVVVGDQSSSKSSLLERLTQIPFPAMSNCRPASFTTSFIRLHQSQVSNASVCLIAFTPSCRKLCAISLKISLRKTLPNAGSVLSILWWRYAVGGKFSVVSRA